MSISDLGWRIGTLEGRFDSMDSKPYIIKRDLVDNKLKAQDTNIINIIALLNKKYPNEIEYLSYEGQLELNRLEQEEKQRKKEAENKARREAWEAMQAKEAEERAAAEAERAELAERAKQAALERAEIEAEEKAEEKAEKKASQPPNKKKNVWFVWWWL